MPVFKKINKDFFKTWSAEMAYVVGFFAADGYMTLNKRGAHFWSIQITDKQLLMSIKKSVCAEHKISVRKARGNDHELYRLQIGSKEMYDDLKQLGFYPGKTKCLAVPVVPPIYLSDFVRGYFDGDGNIWCGFVNTSRKKPVLALQTMFTSCSASFLQELHYRLKDVGLRGGSLYVTGGNYARLQYSIRDSLKLYDIMYNQSDLTNGLFLERKRRVFERYKK